MTNLVQYGNTFSLLATGRIFGLDKQLLVDVCFQGIAILILFAFLSYILFEPVKKMLNNRKEKVQNDLETAAANKEEALKLKETYDAKIKEVDKEAEEILSNARYEYSSGLFAQAEERLRTALVFYPDHVQLYHLLGSTLYKQQKYSEAGKIFRYLLTLNRDDTLARNNLASILAEQGYYQEARAEAEKVYIQGNAPAVTALNLAGICARNGEKQKALYYFREAYKKLGPAILHFLNNRNLDPIRQEKAFREIVEELRRQQKQGSQS